jgi:hypothetical protein
MKTEAREKKQDGEALMMKSLIYRVGKLKITDPTHIKCIHIFSDGWRTVDQEYTICLNWTPVELAEWVFVKVCKIGAGGHLVVLVKACALVAFNHKITRSERNFMLEEYSDHNHTNLTIFELDKA